ncbi:bile acid:sodium symporter [Candidatus Actinomarina sp.]|jgi:BASS family bile acid:Na+ symporter|nr:bile acid:sodium symporter [Candidatus Actinomarina sp.]
MSIEELSLLISSSITFKTITPMIPVMFYFLGTQTTSKDLKDTLKNKVTFSFALFFQMFVLPLIGLTLYLVFNSSIFAISIAIVLLAPGGFISGILTYYKGGNIPLSVSLTSLTSLITPLTTVFWLSIISINADEFSFNFLETLVQLSLLILIPFIVGYFLNSKNIKFLNRLTIFLDKFLKIYVLVISVTGPFELREALIDYFLEAIVIVLIAITVVFLSVEGTLRFLKIDKRDAVTISIEALCQNFPIVLTFSILFNLPQMAVFGIFYYLATLLIVVPYALLRPIK